jgi:hypothetical protein
MKDNSSLSFLSTPSSPRLSPRAPSVAPLWRYRRRREGQGAPQYLDLLLSFLFVPCCLMASALCGLYCRGCVVAAAGLYGMLVVVILVAKVCSNKINSPPQVPPPPPSPLHRCLRLHAAAPDLPWFEEKFMATSLDSLLVGRICSLELSLLSSST